MTHIYERYRYRDAKLHASLCAARERGIRIAHGCGVAIVLASCLAVYCLASLM